MRSYSWLHCASLTLVAITLAGCQTDQEAANLPPPDARAMILSHKGDLWKDPDSIKNASISAPWKGNFGSMWLVCVRANARNAFGGYTGEKDMGIGIYPDGSKPTIFMADAGNYCENRAHSPFPELDGGYQPPPTAAPGKPKVLGPPKA